MLRKRKQCLGFAGRKVGQKWEIAVQEMAAKPHG
jgi:hypothetical protein